MRILFVSSYYPPVQSGSSFYVQRLATALRDRGHVVGIVTVNWKGRVEQKVLDQPDIPVWYLPAMIIPA